MYCVVLIGYIFIFNIGFNLLLTFLGRASLSLLVTVFSMYTFSVDHRPGAAICVWHVQVNVDILAVHSAV